MTNTNNINYLLNETKKYLAYLQFERKLSNNTINSYWFDLKSFIDYSYKVLNIKTVSSKLNHNGAKIIREPFKKNFIELKLDFLVGTSQQSSLPK